MLLISFNLSSFRRNAINQEKYLQMVPPMMCPPGNGVNWRPWPLPFKLNVCEYLSCLTLSNAKSISSRVKRSKSSQLALDEYMSYMKSWPILNMGTVAYMGQLRPHFPTRYGRAPKCCKSGYEISTASTDFICLQNGIMKLNKKIYNKIIFSLLLVFIYYVK